MYAWVPNSILKSILYYLYITYNSRSYDILIDYLLYLFILEVLVPWTLHVCMKQIICMYTHNYNISIHCIMGCFQKIIDFLNSVIYTKIKFSLDSVSQYVSGTNIMLQCYLRYSACPSTIMHYCQRKHH